MLLVTITQNKVGLQLTSSGHSPVQGPTAIKSVEGPRRKLEPTVLTPSTPFNQGVGALCKNLISPRRLVDPTVLKSFANTIWRRG